MQECVIRVYVCVWVSKRERGRYIVRLRQKQEDRDRERQRAIGRDKEHKRKAKSCTDRYKDSARDKVIKREKK